MGAAMGENPDILEEVCRWVMEVAKKTGVGQDDSQTLRILRTLPRASLRRGAATVLQRSTRFAACWGVDLDTLCGRNRQSKATPRPGGYSCQAVMPIALRMCMEIAKVYSERISGQKTLSGIGGNRNRQ